MWVRSRSNIITNWWLQLAVLSLQSLWHRLRQRATLLLLTSIYFCRSGGTVNFTLPFMTNSTISISTSQIFRSWVAIFQPRPPMASLFRNLYDMPGLAPRMDVLSWGRRDFQISFSNRDTSRNAWNRRGGSFMVDTGILSNNMKFPSQKCKMTFCDLTIYNDNPLLIRLCSELDLFRILSGFHRTFATGVACRQGTLIPPDTWSRPYGTCICSTCWDQSFFQTCRYFSGLCSSNIPRYFLDIALLFFIRLSLPTPSDFSFLLEYKFHIQI